MCNRASQTCSDNKGPFLTTLATQTTKADVSRLGVEWGRGARRQAGCNLCACPDSTTAED